VIPVPRRDEPPSFDRDVRQPGREWIAAQIRPINKLPSYWRACEPDLHDAFGGRCGWAAFSITSGQVDHFELGQAACIAAGTPEQAYEWSNYRYVMPELNCRKGRRPAMLDPHVVQPGWFELELPQLHLRMTERVPSEWRELALRTLSSEGLDLARGAKLMRVRRRYLQHYRDGKTRIEWLDDDMPLLATALRVLFASEATALSAEQRGFRDELAAVRRAAGMPVP
jgi:hypothetical protein